MQTKTCPNSKNAILPYLLELSSEISTISGLNFIDETIKSTCDFCLTDEGQRRDSYIMVQRNLSGQLDMLKKLSCLTRFFIFFPSSCWHTQALIFSVIFTWNDYEYHRKKCVINIENAISKVIMLPLSISQSAKSAKLNLWWIVTDKGYNIIFAFPDWKSISLEA